MRIFKFVAVILMLSLPMSASAQQCTSDLLDELKFCIDDAAFSCWDGIPECTEEDLNADKVVTSLYARAVEGCCDLGNKAAIVRCLNKSIKQANAPQLLSSAQRSQLRSSLVELKATVNSSESCEGDEAE